MLFSHYFRALTTTFKRDSAWYNIVITLKDDGHVKLYTNGEKTADETGLNAGMIKDENSGKIQLGRKYNGPDPSCVIQGKITELYIWNVDLGGGDVDDVYAAKCGPIDSVKSSNLIIGWDAIVNSASFNGEVNKICPKTCPGTPAAPTPFQGKQALKLYQQISA